MSTNFFISKTYGVLHSDVFIPLLGSLYILYRHSTTEIHLKPLDPLWFFFFIVAIINLLRFCEPVGILTGIMLNLFTEISQYWTCNPGNIQPIIYEHGTFLYLLFSFRKI